uniref:Uncharacterized protein n=1 Tax=viral metagenome TaxID=1070528 RepID=A0A6C0EZ02_9ZZZZ
MELNKVMLYILVTVLVLIIGCILGIFKRSKYHMMNNYENFTTTTPATTSYLTGVVNSVYQNMNTNIRYPAMDNQLRINNLTKRLNKINSEIAKANLQSGLPPPPEALTFY